MVRRSQVVLLLLVVSGLVLQPAGSVAGLVDTTPPPAPTFIGAPPALTNSSSATIGINFEAGATLACSVNSGAWYSCSSPLSLSGLPDGLHSLEARATDAAGNEGPIGSVSWIVDRTPPAPPALSGVPSQYTLSTSAIIGFIAEADAVLSCSLDGAPYSPCGSNPKAISGLADGLHTLGVKATDQAGNTSSAATASWTVDTQAPSPPVLGGTPNPNSPGILYNGRSASFSFSGEAGAVFTCAVDGGGYEPCGASPLQISGLADGDHTVSIVATDPSGKSSDPATASWTVDATPPEKPTLTNTPPALTTNQSVSIDFSSEPGVTFTCRFDSAAVVDCGDSPWSKADVGDGSHTLTVTARDAAGNTSSETARWSVGLLPPAAPVINDSPEGVIARRSAIVEWTSEAGSTSQCSVDGRAFRQCKSPLALSGMRDGRHSLAIRLLDPFGMRSAISRVSWKVDSGIPGRPRMSGLPALLVKTQSVKLKFAGRRGLKFQCRIDEGAWRSCKSPYALSGRGLSVNWYGFSVRQVSKLGTPGAVLHREFNVTPPISIAWTDLSGGEMRIGLDRPADCVKGKFVFDLWGSGVGKIHFAGNGRCGYASRRLSTGQGVEGRISPAGITLTIKGSKPFNVSQKFRWKMTFAGGRIGGGRVQFKRLYYPGAADQRVYADTDFAGYWDSGCVNPSLDSSLRAYCTVPGYPAEWASVVRRW